MQQIKAFIAKEKANISWIILGIYAVYSTNYLFKLIAWNTETEFSFSVMMLPVCAVILSAMRKFVMKFFSEEDVKVRRRRGIYAFILSGLFGVSLVLGYQLQAFGYTLHGIAEKMYILFTGCGIGVAFMPISYAYFKWLDEKKAKKSSVVLAKGTTRKFFWISWAVIFLAWIPAFLAYYPAILSYDCHRQIRQAVRGYAWFNTHHPLAHTFLIRLFLTLGEEIGSYEVGMAIFSILQMVIMSVVFAYACNMIGRITRNRRIVIGTATFFALLPIHHVLVLCITKDILFTAFFLLLCLLVLEFNQAESKKAKILLAVAMVLIGILAMLFRNNAIYAFAVFAVIYIIWSKKERIIVALLCIMIIAGGRFGADAIQDAMGAGDGSKAEMFSVFLCQFARVGVYQVDSLSTEQYEMIEKYVDDMYWSMYNPHIADGIKDNVAASTFPDWEDEVPTMLKDWITVGMKYPNDYVDAFLELTRGYWFIDDVSHAEVLGYGEDTNWGLIYTFNASKSDIFEGVENKSVLPGLQKVYQKIVNGNAYYDWPVISMLFKPAFYCWTLLLVMISLLYMNRKRKLILCLLPLAYLLTLLLGPVVNFRYIYPIMVVSPVLVAWMFSNCDWKIKDGKKVAKK